MSAVSEIMSSKVLTLQGDSNPSALDVASLMVHEKDSAVIILEKGMPDGIITERDILKKVAVYDKKPGDLPAKSIMSSPLKTIKAYDSVDTAAHIMTKNNIKRLPVIENDSSLVGMISATNIAKKLARILADDYNRYRSLRSAFDL